MGYVICLVFFFQKLKRKRRPFSRPFRSSGVAVFTADVMVDLPKKKESEFETTEIEKNTRLPATRLALAAIGL
jgi:hypothetical protein